MEIDNGLVEGVIRDGAQRQTSPAKTPTDDGDKAGIAYGILTQRHPSHDAHYWRKLRALYAGGKKLLGDDLIMTEVFPKHRNEHPQLYAERKARAVYMPYAAEIIDHLVAALTTEPIDVKLAPEGDEEPQPLPEFWDEFVKDCSKNGGERMPLQQLCREQILNALQVGVAWTHVDLPRVQGEFASRAEQESAGALDCFCCVVPSECVLDWEEDADGELLWAITHVVEQRRESLRGKRGMVTERWTYLTRDAWAVYELSHKANEKIDPAKKVPLKANGTHPFTKVPLVRLRLPDGLHAMSKLESLAREHFNKRSALAWGELQSLLPELYEFLAPEIPAGGAMVGANQEDPGRAVNQVRGQGFVQIRGGEDKAEFVGPPAEPFAHAMASCNNVRDEMHRVTHQMALSVDNTSAALARSGASKAHDRASQAVVLTALGEYLREHALLILEMACLGRGEKELAGRWDIGGANKFDQKEAADAISEAVELTTVPIPSPTFKRRYLMSLAKLVLGPNATPEDLDTIEEELEENIPDEELGKVVEGDPVQEAADMATALAEAAPDEGEGAPPKKKKPMRFSSRG